MYQAQNWHKARRVVAKVEWHYGELFPRIGFMVTNLNWHAKSLVRFYNKRGTRRAMDQGRQNRSDVDSAFLPCFSRQWGQTATVCLSLKSWKLFETAGFTKKNKTLDLDHPSREVDQDRGKGHPACPTHYVSTGRGSWTQRAFWDYLEKEWSFAAFARDGIIIDKMESWNGKIRG